MAKEIAGTGYEAARQKGKPTIVASKAGNLSSGEVVSTKSSAKAEAEDVKATTYVDHTAAAVHESISDLVALGLVDRAVMHEYDEACLTDSPSFTAEGVRALRERERATQAVFANYLGVSVNTVGQWERGERRATGAAAKLLTLVGKHGLAYIR